MSERSRQWFHNKVYLGEGINIFSICFNLIHKANKLQDMFTNRGLMLFLAIYNSFHCNILGMKELFTKQPLQGYHNPLGIRDVVMLTSKHIGYSCYHVAASFFVCVYPSLITILHSARSTVIRNFRIFLVEKKVRVFTYQNILDVIFLFGKVITNQCFRT